MKRYFGFVTCCFGLSFLTETIEVASLSVCPSWEEVEPCFCDIGFKGLKIYCTNISSSLEIEHLRRNIPQYGPIEELVITESSLRRLPKDIFEGTNISYLALDKVELNPVSEEDIPFLEGNSNTLEEVYVYKSFQKGSGKISFSHLENLKFLQIVYNNIDTVHGWFKGGPYLLNEVELVNNAITSIGETSFSDLVNLRILSLQRNYISLVSRSMFPNNINTLDLSDNQISVLPPDIFTTMLSLEEIYITNNNIVSLEEKTWKPVWKQLVTVWVEDNPLACDKKLRWILDLDFPKHLWGFCAAPEHLRGKDLVDLKPEDLNI
ncbi:leucine-rich repeat transmembrane protein FLRT3-like [Limulus polyphemus]|uniref:Leucine-rich repeat transmembrane protein FLRT3-like n=1 Tax=Limulus polyphemus TaxID=6850 RepID=A0ABM1S516_LIMPO|nr:leucine-rich repeat transmembrane protein FLRT3-like [Limulus polyphemus]XP_022238721.1 leucine-rich repeat transmembrane protein FLRT3-like [Limulus polyphemus]